MFNTMGILIISPEGDSVSVWFGDYNHDEMIYWENICTRWLRWTLFSQPLLQTSHHWYFLVVGEDLLRTLRHLMPPWVWAWMVGTFFPSIRLSAQTRRSDVRMCCASPNWHIYNIKDFLSLNLKKKENDRRK